MKLKILSSAIEDLAEGRIFYDKQGEGLGEYFFDSLKIKKSSFSNNTALLPDKIYSLLPPT